MLDKNFFDRNTLEVAKDLLGKTLVRRTTSRVYKAKIVETEAYLGIEDRASHSFNGRKTDRNKVMYMEQGRIYVYKTYGLHFMLNFVTMGIDNPQAVLIRAIEPLNEFNKISQNRFNKNLDELTAYQKKNLTNGPGKLTQALEIDSSLNGDIIANENINLEDSRQKVEIVTAKRIGIESSKEAKDYPYRFYIKGNPYVSVTKK